MPRSSCRFWAESAGGFAVDDGTAAAYALSVVPSLVGWALLAAPEPWRLAGLGLALLVLGPIDLALVRDGTAPRWFGRLRLILATGAGIAVLTAATVTRSVRQTARKRRIIRRRHPSRRRGTTMRFYETVAMFFVVCSGPSLAAAPPLACRAARSTIEKAICASPEYVAMDREIAALYDRGRALSTGDTHHQLVDGQRAFLHRREGCAWAAHHSAHPGPAVDECLRTTMEARVLALRHVVDQGGH